MLLSTTETISEDDVKKYILSACHDQLTEALNEYKYLYNCIWQFTISDYVAGCSDKGFDYMVGWAVASK